MTLREVDYDAARNGVQLAIRRGDVELALCALRIAWSHEPSKPWLMWHLPMKVLAEVWYLIPYLVNLKDVAPEHSYAVLEQFIKMAAGCKSSRDVSSLIRVVLLVKTLTLERFLMGKTDSPAPADAYLKHPEYVKMISSLELGPDGFLEQNPRKFTKFEQQALDYLKERAYGQGLMQHKYVLMSAIVLLTMRGISEKAVKERVEVVKALPDPEVKKEPLPWFCYTPPCDASGTILKAISGGEDFIKVGKRKVTLQQAEIMWTCFEGEISDIEETGPENLKPTCFETLWQKCLVDSYGVIGSLSVEETKAVWADLRPMVQEATETFCKEAQ